MQPEGPQAARVLPEALRDPGTVPALVRLLDEVLEFALRLLHAERGNVQIADPGTGTPRIAAQRGFGPEFMEYFAAVTDDRSACGRAARQRLSTLLTGAHADGCGRA